MAAYGVFLGLNGTMSRLEKFHIVVIEPEEYTLEKVKKLKKQGKRVIAYLNVGSIEKSRSYFKQFKSITLGDYEGWPDEKWIDISKKSWKEFLVKQAAKWIAQGYDGFYIDNLDVVELYKKKNLYKPAKDILKAIRKIGPTYLMINGADYFINRCIKDNDICFNALQQEEVFTRYDYDSKKYKSQSSSEKKRLKQHVVNAAKNKIDIFLLEYRASKVNRLKIKNFCRKYGFIYYNANSINLT